MLQDGLLFKNSKLCIPSCSMRENLIQEKHNGGMVGHFGSDKTYGQLSHFYFWPKMRSEVEKFVSSVESVSMPREEAKTQAYIHHCLFLPDLGIL